MWNKGTFFILILSALYLNACHTLKKTAETPKESKSTNICEGILNNYTNIQTIDISRMDMNIQFGQNSFGTRGSLKMIRDSVIIISVQPLAGIEMGRAQITKDSVIVIDRFNSRYFVESTEIVGQVFDFDLLQSLFCNQIFTQNTDAKEVSKKNFAFYSYPNGCELRTSNNTYDFNFFVNQHLEKTIITDRTDPYSLTCEYADFVQNGDFEFPNKLNFTFFDGQRSQHLDISIQKIDFNKVVNVAFSIPKRYKKADIQDFKF